MTKVITLKGVTMAIQAFTYLELDAIRSALSVIVQHKKSIPLAIEPMETAFEKAERAIKDTYTLPDYDIHFIIVPVMGGAIIKE